ncbi:MAG: hypothetical protein ABIN58_06965 [candidate division WOR-3 bacterium]
MEEARTLLGAFVDFLYFPLTTFLSIVGGLLLWFGFFLVGVIARKYERIFARRTHWQFLALAPSGLLIYTIWQGLAYFQRGQFTVTEQWINYTLVLISGFLCLWGAYAFRKVAERIMTKGVE